MAGMGIPVGVVEDHPLYRMALVGMLRGEPDLELDAAAETVTQFAARQRHDESVVLFALNRPGVQDMTAVMEIVRRGHKVLVISAQAGRAQVLGAMDAGARGYLCKDADATEILRAIREIAAGRRYVSPTVSSFVPAASASRATYPELSMREIDVLAKLAAGERDQDIADALQISVRTVRSYLDRIRDKTGLRRRPELTRYAIGRGYVDHGSSSDQLLPA